MSGNQLNFEVNGKRKALGDFKLDENRTFTIYEPNTNQMLKFENFRKRFLEIYPEAEGKVELDIEAFDPEVMIPLTQDFLVIAIPELDGIDLCEMLSLEDYTKLGEFMKAYMDVVFPLEEKKEENKSE